MIRKPVAARTGTNAPSRTGPGTITVHTRWMYSDSDDCVCCPGMHAFSRGGDVVESSWPPPYNYNNDLASHLHRAIASYGDDVDLRITVERHDPNEPTAAEERAYRDGLAKAFEVAAIVCAGQGDHEARLREDAASYGVTL